MLAPSAFRRFELSRVNFPMGANIGLSLQESGIMEGLKNLGSVA